ncbi:MAG: hypothetical protein K0S61_2563 [Anaerocolumna sp.]|nr:hypothetical protein [Anaerocolumna sp.]
MKEKLYTIPVNEAFDADPECPVCQMKKTLEESAIEFTMGPSYMEEDVREETDKIGFCSHHLSKLYENQNRLGLALMLKTHMDKTIADLEKLSTKTVKTSSSFLKKKSELTPVKAYVNHLDESCYICNKVNNSFNRYILTLFTLYNTEEVFRNKFKNSKGICTSHFGLLYEEASNHLSTGTLEDFRKILTNLYVENMNRVKGDLEWFIDKFDYRYVNEPWKNSKDALIRTMVKTNSIL